MKKLLVILALIVAFTGSAFAAGNEYFNLKAYYASGTKETNLMKLGWAFYNYATYTVKVSDFRVVAYVYSTKTAAELNYLSSGGQGAVYTGAEGHVRGITSAWTATYSDITATDCGIARGVSRQANVKCVISYAGTEDVESGYHYHTTGTNYWIGIRNDDWSTFPRGDDYSDEEDDTSITTSVEGEDWKYLVLEYNDGSGWEQVCEITDSSGTMDTLSGEYPCGLGACIIPTPTVTQTVTQTITQTVTETVTPTITLTVTPTITLTVTETITETVTPTVTETSSDTPTFTVTTTPTHTYTETPQAGCVDVQSCVDGVVSFSNQSFQDLGPSMSFYVPVTWSAIAVFAGFNVSDTASNSCTAYFRCALDGSTYGQTISRYMSGSSDIGSTGVIKIFPITSTGNHTISMQGYVDNGTTVDAFNIGNLAFTLNTWDGTSGFDWDEAVIDALGYTITSISYQSITTVTVDLPVPSKILAFIRLGVRPTGALPRYGTFALFADSTTDPMTHESQRYMDAVDDAGTIVMVGATGLLNAGTHTITLKGKTSSATRPVFVNNSTLYGIALGSSNNVVLDAAVVTVNAAASTTITAYTDVPNSTNNIVLNGLAKIMWFTTYSMEAVSAVIHKLRVLVDGDAVYPEQFRSVADSSDLGAASVFGVAGPKAVGSHTLKLQHASEDGKEVYTTGFTLLSIEGCKEDAPTVTVTPTITSTFTATPTVTRTFTPTDTATVTQTITETVIKTVTQTVTETITRTVTQTVTETVTETVTPTITETSTHTYTLTVTPTITLTSTPTITPTNTPYYYVFRKGATIIPKADVLSDLPIVESGRNSPNGQMILIYDIFGNDATWNNYINALIASPDFDSYQNIGTNTNYEDYKYVTGTAGW